MNEACIYWLRLPHHDDFLTQGYIGVSQEPKRRFTYHKSCAKNQRHDNILLERVLNKYGDSIYQQILWKGPSDSCYKIEEVLRPKPNIGWNLNRGGDRPPSNKEKHHNIGRKQTPEHIAKRSASLSKTIKDRPKSDAHKKKISEGMRRYLKGKV